jgi:hypothetical protein
MTQASDQPHTPQRQALRQAEQLVALAIEREDICWSVDHLPAAVASAVGHTVAYELQALKIIAVGWSLAYLMADTPARTRLQTAYWESIRRLAAELSHSAGQLIGQEIDYFDLLKNRFESYRTAINEGTRGGEPSQVIGSVFAVRCGMSGDLTVAMAGSRLFVNAVARVKAFLTDRAA